MTHETTAGALEFEREGSATRAPERRIPAPLALLLCVLAGCGTLRSVERMDESLGALRPPIERLPALAERLDEVADRTGVLQRTALELATTLHGVGDELEVLSGQVQHGAAVVEEVELGIGSLDGRLSDLNGRVTEIHGSMEVVKSQLEGLESIDRHLVVVDESVRALHLLVPLALLALVLLLGWVLGDLHGQRRVRQRLERPQPS